MRAIALVAVVGLLVGFTPPGAEIPRGTIVSTNPGQSKNNQTTAAPFTLHTGATYAVVCDVASTYRVTDASGTAAVATDYPIAAGAPGIRVTIPRAINASLLWTFPVAAGTSTCNLYEVLE